MAVSIWPSMHSACPGTKTSGSSAFTIDTSAVSLISLKKAHRAMSFALTESASCVERFGGICCSWPRWSIDCDDV